MKRMLLVGLMMLLTLPSFVAQSTARILPKDSQTDDQSTARVAHEPRGLEAVDVRRDPFTEALNGATARAGKRAPVDRTAAVDALIAEAPIADANSLVVDLHPSGVPKSVVNLDGVLTSARSGAPDAIARDFLTEHSALFGLPSDEVQNLRVTMDNLDGETGVTYLKYEQTVGGIPVFDSEIGVTISGHGEVVVVNQGQTIPGAVVSTDATLTEEQAVAKAFAHCGVEISVDALRPSAAKRDEASEFVRYENPLGGGRQDVLSQKTVVNVNGDAVLAYRTIVPTQGGETYDTLVDAHTGELLVRANMTHDVAGHVFKRDPTKGRTLEQFTPLFGVVDPWVNPAFGTQLGGNNILPMLDRNGDNNSDPVTTGATGPDAGLTNGYADSSKGNPAGQFSFPWSVSAAPTTQGAQSVTNLFYLVNSMHDWMYSLGFTESARNFQYDNYGRGGAARDYVIALAQSSVYANSSNFTAPPDGSAGTLVVGIYTTPGGLKDSGLDGDVVLHEYGHGVSSRLIGNGSGLNGLQSAALGEGWSDYWAISNYNDGVFGEYSTYNLSRGLRRAPYTAQANGIHNSYLNLGNQGFEPHNDGEIWAATLWDLNRTLGKEKADKLVLTGMKNTPTSPSFVNARSGVITACQTLYPTDLCAVWAVFARHGLGYSANGNDGTTHNAAFNLPASCGGGTMCDPTQIGGAQTITGTLTATDCLTTSGGNVANSTSYDRYTYVSTVPNETLTITMSSSAFVPYLRLRNASGTVIAVGGTASSPSAPITKVISSTGTYTIEALSYFPGAAGAYTISLDVSRGPGSRCAGVLVPFAVWGTAVVDSYTVTRSGTHFAEVANNEYSLVLRLYKWNGAAWQEVPTEFSFNSSTFRSRRTYTGESGTYRWTATDVHLDSHVATICNTWP